jgi:hypothetical protein
MFLGIKQFSCFLFLNYIFLPFQYNYKVICVNDDILLNFNYFFRWGFCVASHPYQSLTGCLLFTLICSMGLMNFTYEDRPDKLLISQTSQLAFDTDWLRNNFPSPVRFSAVIFTSDNVLSPQVLLKVCLSHIYAHLYNM